MALGDADCAVLEIRVRLQVMAGGAHLHGVGARGGEVVGEDGIVGRDAARVLHAGIHRHSVDGIAAAVLEGQRHVLDIRKFQRLEAVIEIKVWNQVESKRSRIEGVIVVVDVLHLNRLGEYRLAEDLVRMVDIQNPCHLATALRHVLGESGKPGAGLAGNGHGVPAQRVDGDRIEARVDGRLQFLSHPVYVVSIAHYRAVGNAIQLNRPGITRCNLAFQGQRDRLKACCDIVHAICWRRCGKLVDVNQ